MIATLIENYQLIAGAIVSVVAFFGGKKIKVAEENKATSEALTSMQSTYDVFVNDLRERYSELKEEINVLKSSSKQTQSEIAELRKENKELTKELRVWETKYNTLKKEFDLYKNQR